jgi:hypothetical protein
MNRRQFIAGLGAATTGASAVLAPGAFTSVRADRSLSARVADNAAAFLPMVSLSGFNDEHATADGGTIGFDFITTKVGESGADIDSVYEFNDAARTTNQGTQPSGPLPTAPGDRLSDTCTAQSWCSRRTTNSGDC